MASPFQQQARFRKLLYIGAILLLFTLSLGWRQYIINSQASRLAIREESRGEVELLGSVIRHGLTGSRGLVICFLWNSAIEKQKKNQWNELEVLVRTLTKLQPHFITPWLFQSWNLSYNVSVESDRVRDKYFYVTRGVELLAEGERQNRFHPDLRWSIGFYAQHKICQSDETNYQRSLFQLSLIPPNEREPARFWKESNGERVFNWVEFHKFTQEHPQLVRRLRNGMHRDSLFAKKQQFTCETPEAVVAFLEDNFSIPSMYRFVPPSGDAASRVWNPNKKDEFLFPEERFPVLPPPRDHAFDPSSLTSDSTLRDSTDAYGMAQAWYAYAQEPLPDPDELPGSSKPITNRATQRRPKHMTTLIFRNYPAQGLRFMAERLQQEGWYDEEPWDVSDWFEQAADPAVAGKQVKVGGGVKWSEDAWKRAAAAWQKHGEDNHLLFPSAAAEQRTRDLAEQFHKRHGTKMDSMPPKLREENMTAAERDEFRAAKFMFEYGFYRRVSNFEHHHLRTRVEALPETVACRKLLFQAEDLNLAGSPTRALEKYQTPVESPAWPGRKLNPLEVWRDLVLMRNKDYRRDLFVQEVTAEIQLRYQLLYNRFEGKKLKEDLGRMAAVLPLVPKFTHDTFRPPVFLGPFDRIDSDGVPLIEDRFIDLIMDRMRLPKRKKAMPEPPSASKAGTGPKKRPRS